MTRFVLLAVLVLANVGTALAIVRDRHEHRLQFIALSKLEKARDELNIEFGRLQLEQATWAESNRVDQVARARLGMKFPRSRRHRGGAPVNLFGRHVPGTREHDPRERNRRDAVRVPATAARAQPAIRPAPPPDAGRRHPGAVFGGVGGARRWTCSSSTTSSTSGRAMRASCARSRSPPRAA